MIGRKLSHYDIHEKIGAGGMGEVYRATDQKLGRDVAIKVLRKELATDPERLRRFEQEARSASALNHPNIITIYEIGEHDGTPYIAMELVDGKTLREMLSRGPLSTKSLLQYATQIAEGLAKAHSAGIVHRDLKPENLMVTGDGYVKILDFGLAKLRASPSDADSRVATATREGAILGTVGYMSPEQAKGQPADQRSDQFSLGAILYEMATGKRAFQRPSSVETLAAILDQEPPPLRELSPDLPRHLNEIVARCLEKAPENRYDATPDLVRELVHEGAHEAEATDLIRSLVVLPLANLSADPEQEFFSDGMTEALITDLAKIGALKVISRTTAMRYKRSEKPLPEIARELNVDGVLEGSVLKAGERVRITAQLIRGATDEHLWAESYDRDLKDILNLQSEVAKAIAKEIKMKLTPDEQKRLATDRPVNPEAHEAYLKGHYYFNKYTLDAFERAVSFYQLALDKDPNYGAAYAGLAMAWGGHGYWGFVRPRNIIPKAKAMALKAAEMGGGEALGAVGANTAWLHWNWSAALKELKRAVELHPSDTEARLNYALVLGSTGRLDDGMVEVKKALELDPLNLASYSIVGWHYYALRQYRQAIEECQTGLEIDPNFFILQWILWRALREADRLDEAMAACKAMLTLRGMSEAVERMERGYAELGYGGAMLAAAQSLSEHFEKSYFPPSDIAILFIHADEEEEALRWLEQAVEEHDPRLHTIAMDPDWDDLRSEPRFQAILQRMGLPQNS